MQPRVRSTICLVFICTLVMVTSSMGETAICAYCKKPIETGKWFKIDGLAYHYNHFLCSSCGQPIGDQRYVKRDGAYYDSLCFVNRFSKRCAYCGEPMSEWVSVGGEDYHDACYTEHVAERCALCGQPILGNYLYDSHGGKIHADHKGAFLQCDYCSRFITGESDGGEKYPDGRIVCGICMRSVVRTQDEADSLLQVARDLLLAEGVVLGPRRFDLELSSRSEMGQVSGGSGRDKAGFTHLQQSSYLGGLITENEVQIYILTGMPRIHVLATAAHELMHVWLGLHDRFHTEDVLAEGSCNYAASLVLQHYPGEGEQLIERMMQDKDPIYGEGFRRVRTYVESVGVYGWLQYLKEYDFPPWTK